MRLAYLEGMNIIANIIGDVSAWLSLHWVELGSALALTVGAARIVVKLTPSQKDDNILARFIELLRHIGLQLK